MRGSSDAGIRNYSSSYAYYTKHLFGHKRITQNVAIFYSTVLYRWRPNMILVFGILYSCILGGSVAKLYSHNFQTKHQVSNDKNSVRNYQSVLSVLTIFSQ